MMLLGRYAASRFGQVHATVHDVAGGGTPLLLLNPRSRSCLRLVKLLGADRPIHIVDVPAYGASSPPSRPCTMQEVAEEVVGYMDAAGLDRPHLCGFHTGAKVAAAIAASWPERSASLAVCGKSHSLIPDQAHRNQAMRAQVASRKPDVVLIAMETFCADDPARSVGTALVYEANFAFDFAGALARAACPVMVLEIAAPDEDAAHGRQAAALAAHARHARARSLPEVETMGTDLYVGAEAFSQLLADFIQAAERPA